MKQLFNLRRAILPFALLPIAAGLHPAHAADPPVTVATLLHAESDLDSLPNLADGSTHLQSSYDRTGGNGDAGHYLSIDGDNHVMADMDGPGAIVRIWSANADGILKIYIDGSPAPVIEKPFTSLFNGSFPPFTAPLSGTSSGGFYTYLPIPYARHCRVVLEKPTHAVYYQVNYRTFQAGTAVSPFTLPFSGDDQAAVDAANGVWSGRTGLQSPTDHSVISAGSTVLPTVASGSTLDLGSYEGPGVVRRITLDVPDATDADLRRLVLRAYFDGHKVPDIQAPVADFFGDAFGRRPFRTLFLSGAGDGSFEAKFPMPFGKSALFTLENGDDNPMHVRWTADVTHSVFDPKAQGYFHAFWSQWQTVPGRPYVWATAANQRGKYVGVVQTMVSGDGLGFLEGDDQFRVDDETWLPSAVKGTVVGPWNGTGTEDCFNSGWYFNKGPISLPMHALLFKDDENGQIDCMRWFVNDAPVFRKSLDAQIEHGGSNTTKGVYYSSVSYWYSDGPVQPWFTMPAAATLALPKVTPSIVIPGAIEGESLVRAAKATGGTVAVQGMHSHGTGWSHSRQLFWHGNPQPKDTLTLTIAPPAAGTYDIVGYFTRAPDYGQVSFQLNGQTIGAPYDGYAANIVVSGPVDLGTATLPAGPATFVVTVTGKNPAATNYLFGMDAITLRPHSDK